MGFDENWMASPTGDPIHKPHDDNSTVWTTVNAGEVFPGVPTPLTWSVCGAAFETATRAGTAAIGGLTNRERPIPSSIDQRFFNIWFGRAALNVTLLGRVANCMPGSSSDSIEEAYFGGALDATSSRPVFARYPVVAVKLPVAAARARRGIRRLESDTDRWWRQTVAAIPHTRDRQLALLHEAYERTAEITTHQVVNTFLGQGVFERLRTLAESAGCGDVAATAVTGSDSPELDTVTHLWNIAHGNGDLTRFVEANGFHGPGESELASHSWREDDTPLRSIITTYRSMGEDSSPGKLQENKALAAAQAQLTLRDSLGGAGRLVLPALLRQARIYMEARERGRCVLLRAVDVTRAVARAIGNDLVASGVIANTDDVFYLTADELVEPPSNSDFLVAERRAARLRYQSMEVPSVWIGPVEATTPEEFADVREIVGVGASAGVVEGRVRVVLDTAQADLEPGEILVCRTTDPGWASYFQIAAGVVIDIGGRMSHGAIVAREIGIPCVINAEAATRKLRTGDLVRIDGTTGTVEVRERGAEPAPVPAADNATGIADTEVTTRESGVESSLKTAVLQIMRLKGAVNAEQVAAAVGTEPAHAETVLEALIASGACEQRPRGIRLTKPGRAGLEQLLADERAQIDPHAMEAVYAEFTPINADFKSLVTRWQQRDGDANDHSDATYDAAILLELEQVHDRLMPVLERAAEAVPRLQHYPPRFTKALDRIRAGDHIWLLRPVIDSYHTVWFELHEDLIGASGLTRLDEAAAGRAE
jgi:pyruvate,water dikinase